MTRLLIPLVYLLLYGINVGLLKGLQDGHQIGAENQRGTFVIVDVKETGYLNDTVRNGRLGIVDKKETGYLNDTVGNGRLGPDRLEKNQRRAFVILVVKGSVRCLNDTVNRLGADRLERGSLRVKMTHVIWHTSNMLNDDILDRQASALFHVTKLHCKKKLTARPDSHPHSKSDTPNGRRHANETTTDEFYRPPDPVSLAPSSKGESKVLTLDAPFAEQFTSPPLLPGLLKSLKEMVGNDARPTPIQSLSLKWLLKHPDSSLTQLPNVDTTTTPGQWRQFLLASETGSGKSIAYLLPLLQNLKEAELMSSPTSKGEERPYNPRGLILAPTHELARQLSGFAKSLLHEIKLRVLCTSQANQKNTTRRDLTASKMSSSFSDVSAGPLGEFEVTKSSHPVDILVGTPMKVLEMVHGRGWDRKEGEEEDSNGLQSGIEEEKAKKLRRGRDKMIGFGIWRSKAELGLANIEWVVVDEADVLFGRFYLISFSLILILDSRS